MTVMAKVDTGMALGTNGPTGLVAGANVRTPCGERRVEFLRPGDLIVTRNGLQPLRHIFSRTVTEAEMRADPSLAPVTLKSRAIGPMMPKRELMVGPTHRILIPNYLVVEEPRDPCSLMTARGLESILEDVTVDRVNGDVVYYNLVFDAHQVFAANGATVESFRPTAPTFSGLPRETKDSMFALFPDLRRNINSYPPEEFRTLAATEAKPIHV